MSNSQSFGRSLPLDKPEDGKSWKEFNKEKPDERFCVYVGVDSDGMAVIAKKNKIASEIINYDLERLYKIKENGNVAFFYSFKGNLNNCTIEEMNIIAELLKSSFENDYQTYFQEFNPVMEKSLNVKVNFEREMIYLFYEFRFEKEWKPNDRFKEIK